MVQNDGMPVIRVGFFDLPADARWIALQQYMMNLFLALTKFPHPRIRPVIIHPPPSPQIPAKIIKDFEQHASLLEKRWSVLWILRKFGVRGFGIDPLRVRLLRCLGINIISHSEPLPPRCGIHSLSWIPDFQHRHFPQNFAKSEIQYREDLFRNYAENSKFVFLSSLAAVEDFKKAFSEHADKARLLRFAVSVPPSYKPADMKTLMEAYGIPERYLYLPNQFWVHKNHRTIIEALGLIAKRSGNVPVVVTTGATNDCRRPGHFSELQQRVRALGIEKAFLCLGMVPHDHVLDLIRNSVAVVNPSLFEGWSTTVEEAKMLGKPLILSDIPVHREQNPTQVRYFLPENPAEAAQCLQEAYNAGRSDPESVAASIARYASHVRTFSEAFTNTVLEAV